MSGTFEYNGYIGSAEVDVESGHLHGKLLFIRDTITYSAITVTELETAFREAVADYLATCAEEGDEPDVPCKGSFNVRVGPARHRAVAIAARQADIGLNDYVCLALDVATRATPNVTVVHHHEHVNAVTGRDPQQWTALATGPSTVEMSRVESKH